MVKKISWRFKFGRTGQKPKTRPVTKKSEYHTRYNIYQENDQGVARKIKTEDDIKEAQSFVANRRALKPNVKYKIVPEQRKKIW